MSAMLGRSGAWHWGYGASRIMRRSGRLAERRAAARVVQEELAPDEMLACPYGCCSVWSPWGDPWPFD